VATLILPADVCLGRRRRAGPPPPLPQPPAADDATVQAIAQAVRSGGKTALLLGGRALREPGLLAAARIAAHSGVKLLAEVFPTRLERGAGLPAVERIAYLAELAGRAAGRTSNTCPGRCQSAGVLLCLPRQEELPGARGLHRAHPGHAPSRTPRAAWHKLARALGADRCPAPLQAPPAPRAPARQAHRRKGLQGRGPPAAANAIVVDEAITSGLMLSKFTAGAPRHDLITLTGGAIGQGLPNAVGAAIACPDRPVLALIGDGTAMYTVQALWTMAREKLNVTTIIFNNAAYSVLNIELERVGAEESAVGAKARSQLDLAGPVINFADLGRSMGVPSVRAHSTEEFVQALERALATPGPHLIEAMVPPSLSGLKLKMLPRILGSLGGLPQPVARFLKRKIAP
jgi:acetolactate synthase-1/2/3 large subunit